MTRTLSRGLAATFAAASLVFAFAAEAVAQDWALRSPNGRAEIALRTTSDGGLQYQVLLIPRSGRARTMVNWSTMGIVTEAFNNFELRPPVTTDLSRTISFVEANRSSGRDVYMMVTGKQRANDASYTQLSLTFRDDETRRILRVDARAYNDGIAFRYALPESVVMHQRVVEEKTEFNIGLGATHLGQAYDFYTMYHPSYETLYTFQPSGTPTAPTAGTGWGFPSLFERDGTWVLIHESGLDANFQGSHLEPDAPNGVYRIAPPLAAESMGFGANFPTSPLPWTMPWRFFVISDDVGDIAESNMVFHLAPPARFTDTDWIRPGVATWNWLSEHDSGMDLAKLRRFIDLASEMGVPYTLIDANWNLASTNALEDLVTYANTKNVGLLFWYNSGGRHNYVTEQPRNRMDDRNRRRAEFARLQQLGVRGVKVDFFQSDKQDIIRQYIEIMEDAADFHLMTDFHGSTIPRGWERTYPNLMSMEAVRGAEFYSFNSEPDYGQEAPRQNAIHPFLRNVIGSMDYTPVHFSQFQIRRITTHAHEAALGVVFESGLQHISDNVDTYRSIPVEWRNYLASLPTVWDETRILAGSPGEEVVIARRHGAAWYVAGINGENEAKTVAFSLAGLTGLTPQALVLTDDGQGGFASATRALRGNITQPLLPNGGFVMVFRP